MTSRPIEPATEPVIAVVRPPGSKSQTIRALVAAALAEGDSILQGPLESDDTAFAQGALRSFGVVIEPDSRGWVVRGSGGRLRPPGESIDAGASGLTARAVMAIAPLVDGPVSLVGRDRLPERPMGGLVAALNDLGVVATSVDGHLPVTIHGKGSLPGGRVRVDSGHTSQFASALLLAAPMADEALVVTPLDLQGSQRYLYLTIELMEQFGGRVADSGGDFRVEPTGYRATDILIEPDASAAVYPMVAAAITGGRVTIEGLGSGSAQPDLAIALHLATMGCDVTSTETTTVVDASGKSLRGIDADLSGSPDGSLALAVACLFAGSPSRLRGLSSLRFKESDRLAATAAEITRLGGQARVEGDDLLITPVELQPARLESHEDHRMAMSFALVGLRVPGIEIGQPEVVAKTWPGFWDMLDKVSQKGP